MTVTIFRKSINEVFTPRTHEINESMYIERPNHEEFLRRAIGSSKHIVLHGESGNGKTWLYRRVLSQDKVPFAVANCANGARKNSITKEIHDALVRTGAAGKSAYEETKVAGLDAVVASAQVSHKGMYSVKQDEPLLEAFKAFDQQHSGKKVLILDNLEALFSSRALMDELAHIIILCDDPRYACHQVQLLIVGVPDGVLKYFSGIENLRSVSNRLTELPRVSGMNVNQVRELVTRGFKQLKVSATTAHLESIIEHVHHRSLGIPQRVHEYCEALAHELAKSDWLFDPMQMDEADRAMLVGSFRTAWDVVQRHLNQKESGVQRKNQTIFVIGKLTKQHFNAKEIEDAIRKEFPQKTGNGSLGIGQILADLADGDRPMLIRIGTGRNYAVCDPVYVMSIRAMLYRAQNGKVMVKGLAR